LLKNTPLFLPLQKSNNYTNKLQEMNTNYNENYLAKEVPR